MQTLDKALKSESHRPKPCVLTVRFYYLAGIVSLYLFETMLCWYAWLRKAHCVNNKQKYIQGLSRLLDRF